MDESRHSERVHWDFAECPLDAEPAAFGPFESLVALWNRRRLADGTPPPRDAFQFEDFRNWLGRIAIAKVERDPVQLRVVLWGTVLTDWWGIDYTGRVIGELSDPPEAWMSLERAYAAEMDRKPFIGAVQGALRSFNRPFIRVVGIDLPLGDRSGLTHVLSAYARLTDDAAQGLSGFPVKRLFSEPSVTGA